jgi:phosphoglycolate phosphatase
MSALLAVFDGDGTLVDSREAIFRVARQASAEAGLPDPTYDQVRRMVGLSLPQALHSLAPRLTDRELAEFVRLYQTAFIAIHAQPGYAEPLYEGAEDTLRRLKRTGWRLAIATGKSRRGVERWMKRDGWSELFASTHCADDGPGKPDPAMLQAAIREAGTTPRRTVMIGDASHDMLMATAAGVRPQGVAWGFNTAEEILAAGAVHVAADFADLDAELDRFAVALA